MELNQSLIFDSSQVFGDMNFGTNHSYYVTYDETSRLLVLLDSNSLIQVLPLSQHIDNVDDTVSCMRSNQVLVENKKAVAFDIYRDELYALYERVNVVKMTISRTEGFDQTHGLYHFLSSEK